MPTTTTTATTTQPTEAPKTSPIRVKTNLRAGNRLFDSQNN